MRALLLACLLAAGCAQGHTPTDGSRRDGGGSGRRDGGGGDPDGGGGGDDAGMEGCDGAEDCEDGVACTVDACDGSRRTCIHQPDHERCSGDAVCDRVDGCRAPLACERAEECDDGSACNGDETCDPAAGCLRGPPVECGDMIGCTADACVEPAGTCTHTGTDADGDGHVARGCVGGGDCDDGRDTVHPGATEACNAVDDDCSGAPDDGPGMECVMGTPAGSCSSGCGSGGMRVCTAACRFECTPPAETCNAGDDDCDGRIDEGFECVRGRSEGCTTSCGSGGSRMCSGSCSWSACAPPSESCNGGDDDCDGGVDEGFRASVVTTGYSTLVGHHPGCNGSSERMGPSCNAAMHRYCGSRGCTNSGFGPDENSGDVAVVTCVVGNVRETSYSTLATHHGVCNGSSERMGPNCNAAIHRYCGASGFASGFGPIENSGDTAYVTCVPGGMSEVVGTTYSELSGHHGGCNGSSERYGPSCNAAIHRFCGSRGRSSGFGPVENSGDTAVVTCVSP